MRSRVRVDGKFLRLGARKFIVKGVTYGPFAPNARGEYFPEVEPALEDFKKVKELGANVLRVYYAPPNWFLDLAEQQGLKIVVDVPWNKHVCFLDSPEAQREAVAKVGETAKACGNHPAVLAISVVNEIPADIVRWSGGSRVSAFIELLVSTVKQISPDCLATFGSYPPTEYLRPQNIDFHFFNVYLHHPKPFENYLARLQMIADAKPLILGEFGIDSLREGEDSKCEILSWQIEKAFRGGLAGVVMFAFTDDWYKDGDWVTDWAFGVTTADRQRKSSFAAVREAFLSAPYFPLARHPLVSVVVASYNGEPTLESCLHSLEALNYPNYEVILVDDGSTDRTPQICARFPSVRTIRHPVNQGLSAARNTGIAAARGEVVAFTDSDCRADEDWLYYLIGDLVSGDFTGIGGHNLLPPEDSWVAAAVMASPGGPAHVMLTDRLAEHIPGCNMAFYKWSLDEISGFDPVFRRAGDDVDVCWRLQQAGFKLGFSPAGFVWHYRRSTIRAYLKQQRGYGEAEALLARRHPEYFNWFGGSQWQGRIYSPAKFGVVTRQPIIYHGWFGGGMFQTLYSPPPSIALMLLSSLEYYLLVLLPLVVVAVVFRPLWPVAAAVALIPAVICAAAAAQASLPKDKSRFWSRPLVGLLFFLQPIVRGWERYIGNLASPRTRLSKRETLESVTRSLEFSDFGSMRYWNDRALERAEFLSQLIERLDQRGWQNKVDNGWNAYDVQVYGTAWSHLRISTASEYFPQGRQVLNVRLLPGWTLLAKVLFSGLLAVEVVLMGIVGEGKAWPAFTLLSLPLLAWFLARDQRNLQRHMAVFIEELAKDLHLPRLVPGKEEKAAP